MASLRIGNGYIPGSIVDVLLSYQLEGIRFIHRAFNQYKGVILNDESGMGKTHQVVGYLAVAVMPEDFCVIICNNLDRQHHWTNHINHLTNLKVWLFHETQNKGKINSVSEQITGGTQILVVKSEWFEKNFGQLSNTNVKLLVIDETKNGSFDFRILSKIANMDVPTKLFIYSQNLLNNPVQLCLRLKIFNFPFNGVLQTLLEDILVSNERMRKLKKFNLFMTTRSVLLRRYVCDYEIPKITRKFRCKCDHCKN